jgi:hypothetical protein
MENVLRSALGRVSADEELIRTTKDYIINRYAAERSKVKSPAPRRSAAARRFAVAACALLLLIGCPIGALAYYKTPTSYLSIDINPSVELGINAFGKVVTATAYNEDGETILQGQDVVNMDVKDAVNILITSASQHGFILEDGSTIISIISETNNEKNAEELVDTAEEGAEAAMDSEGSSAAIQKDNISLERRDEARELGISPGKLNLIQKLQELDPTITVEQYKDVSVTEIQKKFTELKKEQNGKTDQVELDETETIPEDEPSESVSPDAETSSGNGNGHGNNNSGVNSNGNSGGKQDDTDKPNGNNSHNQNGSAGNQSGVGESQTDDDSRPDEDGNVKPDNGNSGGNVSGNNGNGTNTGLSEEKPSDKPDNGNVNKPDEPGHSSNSDGNSNNGNSGNNENSGNNGNNGSNENIGNNGNGKH